ncbi:hypothetical protein RhiirA5_360058 [Rhizophagus irregularis]|uniref:Phosphatidylglycerol/phosphatidylinositol transfer protein n=2 Tax=Rhizophagus irregularis TaxID=588596 RepID=A0A2I1FAD5_9GLOM|nr:hypothetical protein GLOIN_2v1631297 [Rhizophagus irregularis DAOM 181602=DAOM 197198]PKC06615.1 hypothetical protein RhiirA5_360058 [Rhizophagus irregularis]PKC62251.1 hypothetical protein RhiirA1_424041 [Rhizophagus irregularis]PKK59739.1 hypothetical protein RhiirC2_762417 [Rhizophagus irregularis]PKY31345.1 hypothetical protein RhiirB3_419466 [Rhizophagus irregularis]POG69044.1 hypothetical protein GLOIN_2v1631297 [Rhizophagus irregularis DAOM 181602=DAOM 197198]|eukprot:XP_025175910.1 hypothetical protein GLOIN_2v1631297 [Rhizophagus irregularis DAOM 181602=DAOM 197198]
MMSRSLVFALILLIMVSIVNAIPHQLHKRTTSFSGCANLPPDTPVLSVTLSPDPVVQESTDTFTISGTLKQDITNGYSLYIAFVDDGGNIISSDIVDICKEVTCPVKAGTPYSTTQNVYVPRFRGTTYIVVGIADGIGTTANVIACSTATA